MSRRADRSEFDGESQPGANARMALKIRLARAGAKKRPFYRIVVADSRRPRDGRFIERLGTYNPLLRPDDPDRVTLNEDRVRHWLGHGAKPTDRVARFLGNARIIPAPARRNNPIKAQPGKKARERLKAAEEAAAAAAAAAAEEIEPEESPPGAPAEEETSAGEAEEPPAAEAAADGTAAEESASDGEGGGDPEARTEEEEKAGT